MNSPVPRPKTGEVRPKSRQIEYSHVAGVADVAAVAAVAACAKQPVRSEQVGAQVLTFD
jgi:hypothetical protein